MSDGGKGSTPRPFAISYREFSDNWDRVFNKEPELNPLQPNDWQDVLSTYDCFDIEDTTDVEKQQER
jgi:hypothetical protein